MAGLGCGSYKFSNNVNTKKSYCYVKLTESAHKALEEYLKHGLNTKGQKLTIAFGDNEGEIKIPGPNHGVSTFKYATQKAQESEGPQGSFESIRQTDSQLDSLGPLMNIMRIQAKDDSYEKTRQSVANVMAQNGKNCVKELKPNGVVNRHRSSRSNMVVMKKEPSSFSSNLYSSHNGTASSSSSTSPHSSTSAAATHKPINRIGSLNPLPRTNKINEALKKRPMRERIIHLLAVKPLNKLQLLQKLHTDGVKESDKRKIMSMAQGIAVLRDNHYQLPKHLWSEVSTDWPFYTEEEKQLLKRNRPPNVSPPPARESSSSSPHSPSENVKRSRPEPVFDPTAKRPRYPVAERVPEPSIESTRTAEPAFDPTAKRSSGSFSRLRPPPPSLPPTPGTRTAKPRRSEFHPTKDDRSPPATSVSPLSQNNSPKGVMNPLPNGIPLDSRRNQDSSRNYSSNTRAVERPNESSRNYSSTNGADDHPDNSSPSSIDSQQENYEIMLNYREQYPKIVDNEQRRRYKIDFNRMYTEYQGLHQDLGEIKLFFDQLEVKLQDSHSGTPEFDRARNRIIEEYESRKPIFQRKKEKYNHLDVVLKHIKQHVTDFDSANLIY